MKRFLQFLCLFLLAGSVLAAGRLADVEIYDRAAGRTLPIYESGGHWFVAGRRLPEVSGVPWQLV